MDSVLIEDVSVSHNLRAQSVKTELLMKNKLLAIQCVLEFVPENVLMVNLDVMYHAKENVPIHVKQIHDIIYNYNLH